MKIIRPQTKVEISERQRRMLQDYIREQVRVRFGLVGYDPVLEMALIAADPDLKKAYDLRLSANKEVAKYWHPQLKQVEFSGPDGGPIETKSNEGEAMLKLLEQFVKAEG